MSLTLATTIGSLFISYYDAFSTISYYFAIQIPKFLTFFIFCKFNIVIVFKSIKKFIVKIMINSCINFFIYKRFTIISNYVKNIEVKIAINLLTFETLIFKTIKNKYILRLVLLLLTIKMRKRVAIVSNNRKRHSCCR